MRASVLSVQMSTASEGALVFAGAGEYVYGDSRLETATRLR